MPQPPVAVRESPGLHPGNVVSSSEGPKQGARFPGRLPPDRNAPPPSEGIDQKAAGPSIRVLVIEDYADAAEGVAMFVGMLGHRVEIANTGRMGIEMARRFLPELVLCDVGLPDLDGYAVARLLRQDPLVAGAFLVALSGYGGEQVRRRAEEAGFDRHVCKPIDPSELRHLIGAVVGSGSC